MQILAGTANSIASFSYSWDTVGNLASRADTTQGYTETFCYDALNRLTNSAFGAACTGGKTIAYDALGNLTSKSDTGTYSYPAAGQARPHAVSSITGTVNGVTNPAFAYDANGNMTSGAGRSVSWTSFNLANQVTQGTTTVAFTYDSEHARIVQSIGGASPSTTTYLNALGAVSEKVVAGTTTVWRDYIYAAGSLVAERYCTGASPCAAGNASMRYMVSDHLGSPSSLTDANGAVTNRLSYDAWGQRRNASGSDAICGTIPSDTTRGFTGHEMMDAVCLVNMNARLYDPAIGRFMSADSIVPDPLNGQSFNRYAYVLGNPLRYTDPSGHDLSGSPTGGPLETVIVTASRIVISLELSISLNAFDQNNLAGLGGGLGSGSAGAPASTQTKNDKKDDKKKDDKKKEDSPKCLSGAALAGAKAAIKGGTALVLTGTATKFVAISLAETAGGGPEEPLSDLAAGFAAPLGNAQIKTGRTVATGGAAFLFANGQPREAVNAFVEFIPDTLTVTFFPASESALPVVDQFADDQLNALEDATGVLPNTCHR